MRAVVFDMDGLMFNTEEVYTAVGTELSAAAGLRVHRRGQRRDDGPATAARL